MSFPRVARGDSCHCHCCVVKEPKSLPTQQNAGLNNQPGSGGLLFFGASRFPMRSVSQHVLLHFKCLCVIITGLGDHNLVDIVNVLCIIIIFISKF